MAEPTLINLHPNKYSLGLRYHPFTVNSDRFFGRCNTLNDLYINVCVPDKIEDLNLNIFNIIIGVNSSKTLTKHFL